MSGRELKHYFSSKSKIQQNYCCFNYMMAQWSSMTS